MREIVPVRALDEFRRAFDNGGRFWNLFAKRDDGVIAAGELASAAESATAGPHAILHFELHRSFLPEGERAAALALLDPALRARHGSHAPVATAPSRMEREAGDGRAAILTGVPTRMLRPDLVGGMTEFRQPTMGAVAMTDVPLHLPFTLYEMHDTSTGEHTAVLAVLKAEEPELPRAPMRVAGIVRELVPRKGVWTRYMEGVFFARE